MTALNDMPQHFDELIARIYAINPKPGDTIVLESGWALTPEQAGQLRTDIKPHFPDNEIVVLMDLSLKVETA